jgi:hypothetical protein
MNTGRAEMRATVSGMQERTEAKLNALLGEIKPFPEKLQAIPKEREFVVEHCEASEKKKKVTFLAIQMSIIKQKITLSSIKLTEHFNYFGLQGL